MAEEQVGDDVEVLAQREVLEDCRDSRLLRVLRRREFLGPPAQDDLTFVGAVDFGDDLDQGGFARAVVADESDDFAAADGQVDIGQCLDRTELRLLIPRSSRTGSAPASGTREFAGAGSVG